MDISQLLSLKLNAGGKECLKIIYTQAFNRGNTVIVEVGKQNILGQNWLTFFCNFRVFLLVGLVTN